MSKSSKRIKSLLFVFVVSVSLVCADLVVLAQNENTQDDQTRGGQMTSNTQTGNATGGNTNTGGRRRRGRRRSSASAGANVNTPAGDVSGNASMTTGQDNTTMTGEANMSTGTGGRRRRRGRRRSAGMGATAGTTMTTNVSGGEQTDLSGTYTGTVDYPEGGLTGDATLTITGNNFTLTAGSATQSGRVTAVTTRGYTAVTMMFGDLTPPAAGQAPAPLPAVSLRARRSGTRVTLNSVPGEKRHFAFSVTGGRVGGGVSGGRRRRRGRSRPAADANMTGGNMNMSTPNANHH